MTELSMEARALIERVGLADGPSAERRARVRRHLVAALATAGAGLGGVTPAAAASAHVGAAGVALGTATGKSVLTLSSVAVWLAAGAGLGTLVATPALVMRLKSAAPSALVTPAAPAKTEVRAAPALPAPAAPDRAPNAAREVAERKARPAAPPALAVPSLSEETALLARAQRELGAGNAASALSLLAAHAERFPNGALAEERSAARVLALCALGRVVEARRDAELFAARSPRSPLIPRLRDSCALAQPGDPNPAR
ncbi:MAG TPA: hypothetical protein VGK73_39500 [Polyangiaceae bacterium]